MIALLVSIMVGWLLLRWLCRTPMHIEAPPPQIVIHIHSAQLLVQTPPSGKTPAR
jgi:hypothetical protein